MRSARASNLCCNFAGPDGKAPEGNLLLGTSGNKYGTASSGGANDSGTVFVLGAGGTLVQLHSFGDSQYDGIGPASGLVLQDGVLFGTTTGGGAHRWGTIFAVDIQTGI
jgi:uncharacterized repeat protein (TIGR03803 family)